MQNFIIYKAKVVMGLKLVKLSVPSLEPEKDSTKQRDCLSQIKVLIVFYLIMKVIEGRKKCTNSYHLSSSNSRCQSISSEKGL